MTRSYQLYARLRQAATVLALMPVVATFGTVFVAWSVFAYVARGRGR